MIKNVAKKQDCENAVGGMNDTIYSILKHIQCHMIRCTQNSF